MQNTKGSPLTTEECKELRNDLLHVLADYRHGTNHVLDDDATTNVLNMWIRRIESYTGQKHRDTPMKEENIG